MLKKLKKKSGFMLLEILLAITLFVSASTILTYSLFNGLICQKNFLKPNNVISLEQFFLQILTTISNIKEAESISSITLPTGQTLNTNITIKPTEHESVYHIILEIDGQKYSIYLANKNWGLN